MSAKTCKKILCNGRIQADFRSVAQASAAGELTPEQQRSLRNLQNLWANAVLEICPEAEKAAQGPVSVAEWCTTKTLRGELTDEELDQLIALDEKTMKLIGEVLFPTP